MNSKKEEDVKKIEELAGEIEELNIKSSDIKKLIDIISFIEILKGKTSKKDKEFLSFFIDELSKDNNNLIRTLNEISLKFKIIEELFTGTLDTSEYPKTIIHNVIFSSQFIIENIVKQYICSISYSNNENFSQNLEDKKPKTKSKDLKSKSFMKILESKDKILLRQKKM